MAGQNSKKRQVKNQLSTPDPIAIVGMGCRFPGGANDGETFWRLLRDGVDAIVEVPKDRWKLEDYYDADPDKPGKMYTRWGGFLQEDVSLFDAKFFGLTDSEAQSTDPQQRIFLEVCWEALENGCINPKRLAGTRTGVFVGIYSHDYADIQCLEPNFANPYSNLGMGGAVIAGRVSHFLDLRGPSLSIDTASSASLVAIHQACQSLRLGECDLALTGGVNLVLSPEITIGFCKSGAMAPDGRCKSFDESGNGYVRGEGCGVIVLKRLSEAQRDGDRILAVILGSAVNQDGHTPTIMAPSQEAQEALLQDALDSAGIEPSQVGYIEAHGTGTPVGDPIEAGAITKVLKTGRQEKQPPLYIGSVKTNIGHLESAAGVAGVIKVVLALQNRMIPKNLNFRRLNPKLPLPEIPAEVPTDSVPFPVIEGKRTAGVNSFGFCGTNAHLILQEAPSSTTENGMSSEPERGDFLLTVSARHPEALKDLAGKYANYLKAHPEQSLPDICFTANAGRYHFEERLAVLGKNHNEMSSKLQAYAERGELGPGTLRGTGQESGSPKLAFLFSGQGSQYFQMGQGLYRTEPVFQKALDQCAEILKQHLDFPLLKVIYEQSNLLDNTRYTQPALFALEFALSELWKSWGVVPQAVMGHSVGELVAACVAGVFRLEDGLKLISSRARLMSQLSGKWGMGVVSASEEQVRQIITKKRPDLSIAAVNGPDNTAVSGELASLKAFLEEMKSKGYRVKELRVSHGFHSAQMDPMLDEFERVASEIKYSKPQIPLISNLTGQQFCGDDFEGAKYWRTHAREAVRFSDGMRTLWEAGFREFVEIGPGAVLLGMGQLAVPAGQTANWLPSLRQDQEDSRQILESTAGLYTRGTELDWEKKESSRSLRRKVSLPTYPFQRRSYWIAGLTPGQRPKGPRQNKRTLGGYRIYSARLSDMVLETRFSVRNYPVLESSTIYGAPMVPAATFLAQILIVARENFGDVPVMIEAFEMMEPLYLLTGENRRVQLIIGNRGASGANRGDSGEGREFELVSHIEVPGQDGVWKRHARGSLKLGVQSDALTVRVSDLKQKFIEAGLPCHSSTELGPQMETMGYGRDRSFQWTERVWVGAREGICEILSPLPAVELSEFPLHPGLIDSCFQSLIAAFCNKTQGTGVSEAYLPVAVTSLRLQGPATERMWCRFHSPETEEFLSEGTKADFELFDDSGRAILKMEGVTFSILPRQAVPAEFQGLQKSSMKGPSAPSLWQQLERAVLKDRRTILETYIQSEVALQLGLGTGQKIDISRSLKKQGIDSLRSVELRNRLSTALVGRVEMPPTLVLDYPTVEALVEFILKQVPFLRTADAVGSARVDSKDSMPQSDQAVEQLDQSTDAEPQLPSEEELEKILQEEMDAILAQRKAN